MKRVVCFFWLCLFWVNAVHALINIEITRGSEAAVPIAVMPFENILNLETEIGSVISSDLSKSGRFKPLANTQLPPMEQDLNQAILKTWRGRGVDNLVRGRIIPKGGDYYDVEFELVDVYKTVTPAGESLVLQNGELVQHRGAPKHVLLGKTFRDVSSTRFRALAHHISDLIYEAITGSRGYFSSRIAYIMIKDLHPGRPDGKRYTLEVSDYDGYNPRALLTLSKPMMSPAWSPDGRKLAYVSFENRHAEIYLIDVTTGRRELLSSFPGINGAPAWSPDGRSLALTLSKDGSPNIYLIDLASKRLRKLTNGLNIDTEPSFHPNGRHLLFTSNRSGGKPNLYQIELQSGAIERLSYEGNYNARASYSPDGRFVVMMHRGSDMKFRIATQDLKSGRLSYLTNSDDDKSPSLAPNGNMVIYSTHENGRRVLGAVSMDGRFQLRLPAREGDVEEPVWSPFLS
jgi:TolB protein